LRAGRLWQADGPWSDPNQDKIASEYAAIWRIVITTTANRKLEPIHNRMPVILDEAGTADWMNLREPYSLSLKRRLVPAPDDLLVVRPAPPLVINVKNEGAELLQDLSLFGQ
jgi:putative SOS response-associated peptidase YedK